MKKMTIFFNQISLYINFTKVRILESGLWKLKEELVMNFESSKSRTHYGH